MKQTMIYSKALIFLILLLTFSCQSTVSKSKDKKRSYLSYYDNNGTAQLKTRVVSFHHPSSNKQVIVVGMIHLGQQSFYDQVDQVCESADLVLSEGIRGRGNLSPLFFSDYYSLSSAERLAELTALKLQNLTHQKHWRNADITLEHLDKKYLEAFFQLATTPLIVATSEIYFLSAWLTDLAVSPFPRLQKSRRHARRKLIFSKSEEAARLSAQINPAVIDKRNIYLLNKLDLHLNKHQKIVLPWGAAHGLGIEKGILERGFEIKNDSWLEVMGQKEKDIKGQSWSFHIPWIIRTGRNSDGIFSLSLLADFLVWHKAQKYSLSIGWKQLFYSSSALGEGALFPQLFTRPLLWDWRTENAVRKHRYLLFFGDALENNEF